MTEDEFKRYYGSALSSYANDLIKCGQATNETAPALSEEAFSEALPLGFCTPDARFYIMRNGDNEEVGHIWYIKLQNAIGYIGDFLIYEAHRRKGYGLHTLNQLEKELIERGLIAAALNAFAFNSSAISLYEKLGYKESGRDGGCVQMVKRLAAAR